MEIKQQGVGGFAYLSDRDLAGLGITTAETMTAIEQAIMARRHGEIRVTPKSAVQPGDGRYLMSTMGVAASPPVMVVKAVVVNPHNPERGLSGINGAIMLLDAQTGLLSAVMDANWITAIRTAGLSAVAAQRMANPRSSSVAFIGSGVQARSHLDAFADLFPLEEVRVLGRGRANIETLCATAVEKGLRVRIASDARDAVEGADLIVSSIVATYDGPPIVDARLLAHGAFATITDLARPWDPEGMPGLDTIVIDDLEQEAAMPDPMVARNLVDGDLNGLVGGDITIDFSPQKRSAFVFRGVAIGDLAIASLAYSRALALGRGQRVEVRAE